MSGWRLFRWVLVRGALSGTVLGALFGAAFTGMNIIGSNFVVCFIGFLAGWGMGGLSGIVLGTVNGLALVLLTHFFFRRIGNMRGYRWSVLLVMLTCTTISIFAIAYILYGRWLVICLPITVIATVAASFFSWRLTNAIALPSKEEDKPLANAVLFYIEK